MAKKFNAYMGNEPFDVDFGGAAYLHHKTKDTTTVTWQVLSGTQVRVTITNPSAKVTQLLNSNLLFFKVVGQNISRCEFKNCGPKRGHGTRRTHYDKYMTVTARQRVTALTATYTLPNNVNLYDIQYAPHGLKWLNYIRETYTHQGPIYGYYRIMLCYGRGGDGNFDLSQTYHTYCNGIKRSTNIITITY